MVQLSEPMVPCRVPVGYRGGYRGEYRVGMPVLKRRDLGRSCESLASRGQRGQLGGAPFLLARRAGFVARLVRRLFHAEIKSNSRFKIGPARLSILLFGQSCSQSCVAFARSHRLWARGTSCRGCAKIPKCRSPSKQRQTSVATRTNLVELTALEHNSRPAPATSPVTSPISSLSYFSMGAPLLNHSASPRSGAWHTPYLPGASPVRPIQPLGIDVIMYGLNEYGPGRNYVQLHVRVCPHL